MREVCLPVVNQTLNMAPDPDPYILSSKEDISLIFTPLKTTHRIKVKYSINSDVT